MTTEKSANGAAEFARNDTRSGLEQVADLAAGKYPVSPMTQLMPFETEAPQKGKVRFTAAPEERHLNGMKIVHGGWAMTMLDNAMGLAAHTMVEAGEYCPSKETSVKFLSKILANKKALTITAWVTEAGDREVAVNGSIETPEGKVLATGVSTCVIVRPGK